MPEPRRGGGQPTTRREALQRSAHAQTEPPVSASTAHPHPCGVRGRVRWSARYAERGALPTGTGGQCGGSHAPWRDGSPRRQPLSRARRLAGAAAARHGTTTRRGRSRSPGREPLPVAGRSPRCLPGALDIVSRAECGSGQRISGRCGGAAPRGRPAPAVALPRTRTGRPKFPPVRGAEPGSRAAEMHGFAARIHGMPAPRRSGFLAGHRPSGNESMGPLPRGPGRRPVPAGVPHRYERVRRVHSRECWEADVPVVVVAIVGGAGARESSGTRGNDPRPTTSSGGWTR